MSYILEALKHSQQARERGQVPRIETPLRAPPTVGERPRTALIATIALVTVAGLFGTVALLRPTPPGADPGPAVRGPESPVATPAAPTVSAPEAPRVLPPEAPAAGPPAAMRIAPAAPAAAPESSAPSPTAADTGLAVPVAAVPVAESPAPAPAPPPVAAEPPAEPQVLVVPAPPKPGQALPRGADELRRAVLGDAALPDEEALEPEAAAARPPPPPEPAVTPVPEDLVAEIQAFKRQLGEGARAGKPGKAPPAPALPPLPIPGPLPPAVVPAAGLAAATPAPEPPLATDRGQVLPPMRMTVHVYNADPAQRFVLINGKKLREREATPEGLRVEEVRVDGVLLSFQGERFFKAR